MHPPLENSTTHITIIPTFKKAGDLHEAGGGAVVVVGKGPPVVVGNGLVVVCSGLVVGMIVVRIGTSQPDWPELKSKFPSVLGQVSNNKQILSIS